MTIKLPDCLICGNSGRVFKRIIKSVPLTPLTRLPSLEDLGATIEECCDCAYGNELQILRDRMNHPEYENPFSKMSDTEILQVLDELSRNEAANQFGVSEKLNAYHKRGIVASFWE